MLDDYCWWQFCSKNELNLTRRFCAPNKLYRFINVVRLRALRDAGPFPLDFFMIFEEKSPPILIVTV